MSVFVISKEKKSEKDEFCMQVKPINLLLMKFKMALSTLKYPSVSIKKRKCELKLPFL